MKRRTIERNLRLVSICLAGMLLASCDSFLDTPPRDAVSVGTYYNTPDQAEAALVGAYNPHGILWGDREGLQKITMGGTDLMAQNSRATLGGVLGLRVHGVMAWSPENPGALDDVWLSIYDGVKNLNRLLGEVDGINFEDPSRKAQIVAEARFLRGYYLFYLSQAVGSIPLPTEDMATKQVKSLPRAPLDSVYSFIEADLRAAYEEPAMEETEPFRADKWAAGAILVEMYVYLAGCKENNVGANLEEITTEEGEPLNSFDFVDADAYWRRADSIAADLYQNSGATLVEDYGRMFYEFEQDYLREETIWQADHDDDQFFNVRWAQGPFGDNWATGASHELSAFVPSVEWASLYERTRDQRADDHNVTSRIWNPVWIGFETEMLNGVEYGVPAAFDSTHSNANAWGKLSIAKFRRSMPGQTSLPDQGSLHTFPVVRYAEVILWYAETRARLGDVSRARELLSELRLRAARGDESTAGLLDAEYRDMADNAEAIERYGSDMPSILREIMDERARELCGEGARRPDLIRTGSLKSAIWSIDPSIDEGFNPSWSRLQENYEDHKIWYPIPRSEISANPNLVQNPGYTDS